jgi:hypothetical protein
MITADVLREILGTEYWVATVPTAEVATRSACDRMAAGRQAVTFTDADGRHCVAWSK